MKRPKLPNVPADVAWDIVAGVGFLLLTVGLALVKLWLGVVFVGLSMLLLGFIGARLHVAPLRRPMPEELSDTRLFGIGEAQAEVGDNQADDEE